MFIVIRASCGFYSPSAPTIRIPIPCHLDLQWISMSLLHAYWVPGHFKRP